MSVNAAKKLFMISLLLADLLAIGASLLAAFAFRYAYLPSPFGQEQLVSYLPAGLFAAGIWILIFLFHRMGDLGEGWRFSNIIAQVVFGWLVGGVLVLAGSYLTKVYYSRLVLIFWGTLSLLAIILVRLGFWRAIRLWRKFSRRRVLLLGSMNLVLEAVAKIKRHPELLYELVGVLCLGSEASTLPVSTPAKSESWTLVGAVDSIVDKGIDEVFVLFSDPPNPEIWKFISLCRQHNILVRILPHPYELYVSKVRVTSLEGLPLLEVVGHVITPLSLGIKRVFDVFFGGMLMLLTAPIMLVIASLIRMVGRRPVLSRELRVGREGNPFVMFRFNVNRTARLAHWEKWLVKYSLTELPQFWNVLIGDMSLVGPRPELVERYKHYTDWHRRRLQVAPGITGYAQVHGLRDVNSTEEKIRYDLQYLSHWSILQDILLLLETIWALVRRFGEKDVAEGDASAAVALPTGDDPFLARREGS